MRLNRLAQVALNDQGRAVCPWLNETTVGPYQRDLGGDVWQMVTRTAGVVTPLPGIVGGCNESAAGNGQWMRYLAGATPSLSGSAPWSPPNGFVGDIDGPVALTLSKDGLSIRVFSGGGALRDIQRWQPFGGVRLKGSIATWFEFNRTPNIIAWDVLSNLEISVTALPGPQYTPVVFEAPSGRWVLYQIDALGGVCHKIDDPSQGYKFGTPKSIYDPDVVLSGAGCILGWSNDASQSQPKTKTIVVLGQGMVPLVIPPVPVDPPIGPTSSPLPDGTTIDLAPYFAITAALWPRGGPDTGNTHAMDMQAVPGGFVFDKFGSVGNGQLYELMAVKDGFVHLMEDASDAKVLDTWPKDTRLCPIQMKTGYANRFTTPDHELVKKQRGTCGMLNTIGWATSIWIDKAWPKFYCGKEQGEQPVIRLVIDNTQGVHGPDRWIETRYVSLRGSWSEWTSDPSDKVFASGVPVMPNPPAVSSQFWRVGGPRFKPILSGCAPSPTIPPEPPVPVPPTPPSNGVMLPGYVLWPDVPFKSQDKRFTLLYQRDGNLVLYGPQGPLWATGTNGQSFGFCSLQGDGNFVVYNAAGQPRWATATNGNMGAILLVQNDGNIVIYHNGRPIWASGSVYNPTPIPIPPGPIPIPDMHAWPKFGASYGSGMLWPDCDPALFAALNRDAGGNFTRVGSFDAWGVAPNGPGQHVSILPWLKDFDGVYRLDEPNGAYDERVNRYVRAQNAAGATVQISLLELYSWSNRKQGLQWVPDQNLGPFRKNRNGVRWGNPDDPTFLALPDDVMAAWIARICVAVKGLAVCFETGNEMPEKDMHKRIAAAVRSHFTADWRPDVTTNRQLDTSGQYFNMKVGTDFERIAYHGKRDLAYLDEVFEDEPSSRPKTFRQLWDSGPWETPVEPKRVIMSSDGCRASQTIENCYDWPVLAEVVKDHLRRGFTFEHQSRAKLRPFLENRLDLRADFETDWLKSLR